jgi:hypothetical protein
MSAPIDDKGFSEPLRYAPPWARRAAPDGAGESAPPALPDIPSAPPVRADAGPAEPSTDGPPAEADPHDPFTHDPFTDVPFADDLLARREAPRDLDQPDPDPPSEPVRRDPARQEDRPADTPPFGGLQFGDLPAVEGRPAPEAEDPRDLIFSAPKLQDDAAARAADQSPSAVAPKPARPEPARPEPARPEPPHIADSPGMVPAAGDSGGFGWLRSRPFEGDVAMRDLTRRLALDPHLLPEPPRAADRLRVPWRAAVFVAALCGAAAAVALALVLVLFPSAGTVPRVDVNDMPALAGANTDRVLMAALERTAPVRLVLVETRRAGRGEPVALAVTLTRGLGEGSLIVSGLATGSRLSTGTAVASDRWRVPLADLGRIAVVPPPGFVGVMELGLELRLPDDTIGDRSSMRIEWSGAVITPVAGDPAGSAAAPPAQPLGPARGPELASVPPSTAPAAVPAAGPAVDPEEIAILLERGKAFVARGDLAAARLLLRRAAEAGDAQAALLLGSTFDPAALRQLEVLGAVGDAAQARLWYQRAAELGSTDAARRLDSLARGSR